jgi:hypothetical protein
VGDIMLGTDYPYNRLPKNDGDEWFDSASPWIKSAHVRFGNFEGAFFDGDTQPDGKSDGVNHYIFRTPTRMVSLLQDAGFNVMSLANNHVRDFGLAGFKSTKQTLSKAGIQFSSKSGEVARFKVEQTSIALIAADFYAGARSVTESADTMDEIRELKDNGELVIVSAHVGGEGVGAEYVASGTEVFLGENRGDSMAFAHQAIDAGADVIIMHGPHVPRGIELYKNRIILYSLGNFVTGEGISVDGFARMAPLVRVEIDPSGEFRSGQIVPFIQKRKPERLEIDIERTAIKFIKRLSKEQFPTSPLVFQDSGLFQ